jgi:hypothetical protein
LEPVLDLRGFDHWYLQLVQLYLPVLRARSDRTERPKPRVKLTTGSERH